MGTSSSTAATSSQCSVDKKIQIPLSRKQSILENPPTYNEQLLAYYRSKKPISEDSIKAMMHLKAFQILNYAGIAIKKGQSIDILKHACKRIYALKTACYYQPGYLSPNLGALLCEGLERATADLLKLYPLVQGENFTQESLSISVQDKQFDIFSQFEQAPELSLYTYFVNIEKLANGFIGRFITDMESVLGSKVECNNKLDKNRGFVGFNRVLEKYCEENFVTELNNKIQSERKQYMDVNSNAKSKSINEVLLSVKGTKLKSYPLYVYDIFRCRIEYSDISELNDGLQKFQNKFPLLRMKNKTGTPLRQVLANFKYEVPVSASQKNTLDIKTAKMFLVAEVQFTLKQENANNALAQFNHKLYEINRAGQNAVQVVQQLSH